MYAKLLSSAVQLHLCQLYTMSCEECTQLMMLGLHNFFNLIYFLLEFVV